MPFQLHNIELRGGPHGGKRMVVRELQDVIAMPPLYVPYLRLDSERASPGPRLHYYQRSFRIENGRPVQVMSGTRVIYEYV